MTDKNTYSSRISLWIGYGVTADGTAVYLGEQQLDADPTRVYAVLKPKSGKTTIVPGGIPDRNAVLPVSIKLPGRPGLGGRPPGRPDSPTGPTAARGARRGRTPSWSRPAPRPR